MNAGDNYSLHSYFSKSDYGRKEEENFCMHCIVYLGADKAKGLPHLNQRSDGDPCESQGIKPKGRHLELPASLHTLPVASNNVQVVIQHHCSETPLVSRERKLRHRTPLSAVLCPVKDEDVSCTFCFWVIPRSKVLFPKAAETTVSFCPQLDNLLLLFFVQTSEVWTIFLETRLKQLRLQKKPDPKISCHALHTE